MKRIFLGSLDESAIILSNIFPDSDLVASTPFAFEDKRSGVYFEGNPHHLEVLFDFLVELVNTYNEEPHFGRWIGVTPPEGNLLPRTIIHYEILKGNFDKIQLLNLVLRKHLAEICDLRLARFSRLSVKVRNKEIHRSALPLEHILNGEIMISLCA